MSHVSLALPFAPAFNPEVAVAIRRAALTTVRVMGFAASCTAAALLVWLMLAGPGLVSDHASTATPRHASR